MTSRKTSPDGPDRPTKAHPIKVGDAADLGRAVRRRRKALGMTQEDLALDIGITRQRLSELEAGKPGLHLGVAIAACKALGITITLGWSAP